MLRFSRALRVGGHSITADAVALHSSKSAFSRLPSSSSIKLLLPGASCSYATSTTIPPNHIFKPYPTLKDSSGKLLARVSGRTDVPLSELSLSQFWDELVQKHADRPALICRHEPPHLHQVGPSSPSPIADDSSCLRWSYADMDAHITSLARGLQNLGIGPGSVVAVLMMNNSAYGALQWATAKLGAILVTLNPSYSTRELGQALNQVKASTLVLVPGLRSSDYLAALNGLMPSLASNGKGGEVEDENFPMLKRLVLVDNLTQRPKRWEGTSVHTKDGLTFAQALEKLNGKALDYRDVLAEGQAAAKQGGNALPQVDPEQVINLQLTSGTTGRPKAVALTSRNLLNNGMAIGQNLKITPNDILCNVPPLFHCFGLTLGNMAVWSHGGAVVYSAEGFDPVRALRAVSEERCTVIHGVPAHFIAELEVLDDMALAARSSSSTGGDAGAHKPRLPAGVEPGEKFDLTSLRTGLTSGSTVPIELMHKIMHTLGSKEQTVVYGMTETSPVSFGCDLDAPVERRCETVGRIYPHCHAKIVDTDDPDGKALPIGQPGELCTGGYIVMQGYWKDEVRTKEALQQHSDEPQLTWMRTGDMAIMDDEGYVRIVGRSKDVIIRGGENLFPVMIENCIDELSGVTQSAAIAVPDERMGEAVGVFIGRAHGSDGKALTAKQIRQHVKDHLSPQSAPEWVFWLGEDGVADDMPKTASGKVKKVDLREWAKELVSTGKGRVKG